MGGIGCGAYIFRGYWSMVFLAQGSRFQMSGWGFRFRDLVCKVSALGFMIQDFMGLMDHSRGCRIQDYACRYHGSSV